MCHCLEQPSQQHTGERDRARERADRTAAPERHASRDPMPTDRERHESETELELP